MTTWRYDNTHQGQNTQETKLTPTNVNTNTFGKLFSYGVQGVVYAQPLYAANLTINGATHNVIFVADEHDQVYAFDADNNGGANSAPLWQANLLSTAHGAQSGATTVPTADVQSGAGDINPEIGITGTPVLDLSAGTLFVEAQSKENGSYFQRLHALNILNGSERTNSPVAITGSTPGTGTGSSGGTLAFSPLWESNRPALGLFNGSLYVAFAAHADDGPWHGWLMVYNETTLNQTAAICTSPNGYGNGIWSAGAGMPIDTVSANGRLFFVTGNGDYTSYPPLNNTVDYGESILRYDLSNGGLAISDAFTSFNQAALSSSDLDQGAGGVLLLPDQPGAHPHLLVQIGKEGRILVLNRDALGGYLGPNAGSNTNAVQDINGALSAENSGVWGTPAYWNSNVYIWAKNDDLKMFPLSNGVLATSAAGQGSVGTAFPPPTPVVSSNGTQNGIVWAVSTENYNTNGSSVLRAFNATNVAQELYASDQNPSRDDAGLAIKFAVPVITNGKVYVGAGYLVDVYGLFNGEQSAPAPVITPQGGTYTTTQQITLTDTVSGAAIYYTIDGSTPTTASKLYSAPFQLLTDATVQAIASATGYVQSPVASATYILNTQTSTPQFSPAAGSYTTTQTVTISDSTTGAAIYYTTDGSMPTTGSKLYSAPLTVSSSAVIQAIATFTGLTTSNVGSAAYTIQLNGTGINYGNGFASVAGMTLNGSATNADDTRLQLTTGVSYQAGSAFYNTPTNIQAFTTDFAFQLSNAQADGFTFAIQNVGPTALGGTGGGLGYGPDPGVGTAPLIAKSVAVKFDFFNNAGEGNDSTGLYVNGAEPTVPSVDMTTSGIELDSGDSMAVHMTYDGTNLAMTLTDGVVNKTFSYTWPINIPSTIGGNLAYIGFTGGSGGLTASQKILNWTLTSQALSATQTPVLAPAGGTFTASQPVTLSDGTKGAVIYYTVDGSTPTTSSSVYSTPININSGSVTIKAFAQAPGATASAVASGTYTVNLTAAATPTFSPGTGTYTSTQSVKISDTTAGATIYYTTNGSTPTTSSTVYSGAISVSASETLSAIAFASGLAQSAVGSAVYVIQTSGSGSINFASGFTSATGLQLNGVAAVKSNALEITNGGQIEANSAFWTTPVNIQAFTTNFTFQLTSAKADGFTFTMQNAGITALGGTGGGLGYGPDPGVGTSSSIANSVAVKFDIFNDVGESNDSTGIYTDGAVPTLPDVDITPSGIVLASGDLISAQLVYNGTTLTLNLTDTVTGKTFSQAFTINIPGTVGGNTAYVGFTGASGGLTAIQNITTWTFTPGTVQTAADPVFNPLPGTYTSAQNVSLSSATPKNTIYYTVDGSTPTTSSTAYSAPIVVSVASLTIRAFATATGYQSSPVVVGAYQIQAAAATPTFSPVAGTYTTTQSVKISDTTTAAVIYYTTDGSTPTTSSAVYGSAISVSASETLKAMATATGFSQSAVGSANYVIQTGAATPTFSPVAGTYTSAQSVKISDSTTAAVIYYTTDGSTPTTSSAVYSSAISVSASKTLKAMATASGFSQSAVGSAAYVIQAGGSGSINFGSGFTSATGLQLNGVAAVKSNALEITDGGQIEGNSAFWTSPVNIQAFTTNFTFQLLNAKADGFTFTIQNAGVTAVGGSGGGLGYGPDPGVGTSSSIGNSVAIKFDIFNDVGESNDSTGIYTDGADPTLPDVDITPSGIVLASGDLISAQLVYNGTTLTLSLTDTVTGKTFSQGFTINIPSTVGGNTAYVGFTGGSGGLTAIQNITTWTFASGTVQTAATPTFSPVAGTYTSAQSVKISDSTTGAVIYYTTDGSTPTTSSAVYSSAISVSASKTLKAMATASGFSQSAVGSAAYVIQAGGSGSINFGSGFTSATGLQLNGVAAVKSNALEITDGGQIEGNSAFWTTPVNIQTFTTNFTFQLLSAKADGFTFTIQNAGVTAVGGSGGGLGYGPDPGVGTSSSIGNSVAIKFDIFNDVGESNDSTGIYTDGADPTLPDVDITPSGIVLASGDLISAQLVYNGTTLTLSLTDTVTGKTFSQGFTINIPSTVGGNTAYVGFTGGSGGQTAIQNITTWTFTSP